MKKQSLEELFEQARVAHLAMANMLTSRMWFKTDHGPLFHDLVSNIEYRRYKLIASDFEGGIVQQVRTMPPIALPEFAKQRAADAVRSQAKADEACAPFAR